MLTNSLRRATSGPANCSATSGVGLNSAQYITIKIAELGSALASNAWQKFITAMNGAQWGFVPPSPPAVDRIVGDIFMMEACMAAWNWEVTQANNSMSGISTVEQIPTPAPYVPQPANDGTRYDYSSGSIIAQNVCGYIFVPSPPNAPATDTSSDPLQSQVPPRTQVYQAIYKAHLQTLQTMLPVIRGYVGQGSTPDISYFIRNWNGSNGDQQPLNNQDFQKAVAQYYSTLRGNLASAYAGITANLQQSALTSAGWIAAGAWMNTISRDQGAIVNSTYDGIPQTVGPATADVDSQLSQSITNALWQFAIWMHKGFTPSAQQAVAPCDQANGGPSGNAGKRQDDNDVAEPLQAILKFVDKQAVDAQLWTDEQYSSSSCPNLNQFTLGTQFTSNNPLGELTAYGHKSIHIALQSLNDMLLAMGAQAIGGALTGFSKSLADSHGENDRMVAVQKLGADLGGIVQGVGSAGAALFGFLAIIFLTIGVTLGFILPLIPFIHFFFASVAWGLVLLEGVVAMPLVSLAHLNPEGDGLPGGMAKQAYFLLFGLFMRPILIVFGLIVSLLVFMMAMFLLNKLFAITVVGTGGLAQGYATVARIIYSFIYVFLAYTCAVNCFKVIDQLPEAVFRWISINIQHQRIADGGNALQSAGTIATGVVTQQGVQALQGMASGATGALQSTGAATADAGRAALGAPGSRASGPTGKTK